MVTNGGSITFTGLSSGIDTGSIVTQLIAVESAPKTLLMQQQAVTNLQNQDYADISTKLYTLKTAADALRSAGYTQFTIQLVPGHEHALADWARIRKAFA